MNGWPLQQGKQIAKAVLYRVAPQWTTALMSARSRAHAHKVLQDWGCPAVTRALVDRLGNRVQAGPFAGLILTPMTQTTQLGPFLLGVYESELDQAWATLLRGTYSQVIDIGAQFGYYAVGLARKWPHTAVVAFDTDRWARRALAEMAAANGTANLDVKGFCTPEWLATHVQDAALVISDCEGYEGTLFNEAVIDRLRSAALIIETHESADPGVTGRLRRAFGRTHAIREFAGDGRGRTAPGSLDFVPESQRHLAIQEVRGRQQWLMCLPLTGANAGLVRR